MVHLVVQSAARLIAEQRSDQVPVTVVADLATTALRGLPALRHLTDETIHRLVRRGRLQRRSRYQHFYHEGAQADGLFILVSGTVRLAAGRDQSRHGREVKPPAVLGLEALAALAEPTGEERLEGAMALRPSVCVHLPSHSIRSAILELAAQAPFYYFEPPVALAVRGSWSKAHHLSLAASAAGAAPAPADAHASAFATMPSQA